MGTAPGYSFNSASRPVEKATQLSWTRNWSSEWKRAASGGRIANKDRKRTKPSGPETAVVATVLQTPANHFTVDDILASLALPDGEVPHPEACRFIVIAMLNIVKSGHSIDKAVDSVAELFSIKTEIVRRLYSNVVGQTLKQNQNDKTCLVTSQDSFSVGSSKAIAMNSHAVAIASASAKHISTINHHASSSGNELTVEIVRSLKKYIDSQNSDPTVKGVQISNIRDFLKTRHGISVGNERLRNFLKDRMGYLYQRLNSKSTWAPKIEVNEVFAADSQSRSDSTSSPETGITPDTPASETSTPSGDVKTSTHSVDLGLEFSLPVSPIFFSADFPLSPNYLCES